MLRADAWEQRSRCLGPGRLVKGRCLQRRGLNFKRVFGIMIHRDTRPNASDLGIRSPRCCAIRSCDLGLLDGSDKSRGEEI